MPDGLEIRQVAVKISLGTFRSENEDDYEYEFSLLNMRIRFEVHMLRTENPFL